MKLINKSIFFSNIKIIFHFSLFPNKTKNKSLKMISNSSSSILNLTKETRLLEFCMCIILANFGFVANMFNIFISLRKNVQKMGFVGLYYVCMSIFNILSFVCMPYLFFFSQSIGGNDLLLTSNYFCMLLPYMFRVFNSIPAWLNVIITYDRIQAFKTNYKQAFLYKKRNLKLVIFGIVLLACSINSANFFFRLETQTHVDPKTNQTSITTTCTASTLVQLMRDSFPLVYRVILPLILEIVLNTMLIIKLLEFGKDFAERTRNDHDLKKAKRFAFTVVILNIVFILGEIPVIVCTVFIQMYGYNQTYISTSSNESAIASFVYLCSVCLEFFVCYSTLPFINILTNKIYRKEVRSIFKQCQSMAKRQHH